MKMKNNEMIMKWKIIMKKNRRKWNNRNEMIMK